MSKICCGGFELGEGLELDGKTLKATGGGSGGNDLYMNTVHLEFDDDVTVSGNCYVNFVSGEKINNINDVFNFLFSHIDDEYCMMPASGTGFSTSVPNQILMVDWICPVEHGETLEESERPYFLISLVSATGYGSSHEVYVPVDGEGWFNNCYISSVKI